MVSLRLFILLIFCSCAKLDYLFDQGVGQLKLLNSGKDNQALLKSPVVSKEVKEKIKLIETYKKYFYEYFGKEESEIYSKTTILEGKAVTHLVIASRFNKVEPIEHCFWPMGCFPYLGFFKEKKANEFVSDLEDKNLYVYKRPVYAYSTLGYFTDNILSSFFYYDEYELAELIFHELFHTIFFIKNEVDLNENLANYFGKEMAFEYFSKNNELILKQEKKKKLRKKLSMEIVELTKRYKEKLESENPQSKDEADRVLKTFLKEVFEPKVKALCHREGLKSCKILDREWNNASMSAYLTYEDKMDKIEKLRNKLKLNLKDFYRELDRRYKDFEGDEFTKELFKD